LFQRAESLYNVRAALATPKDAPEFEHIDQRG
jgi:hypothetical protein